MRRFVTLLLAGATIVAAQTATQTKAQEMEALAVQLQEKLATALKQAGEDVDNAQKAVMEYQKQMKGKSAEEAAKLEEQRKAHTQAQLEIAIKNLEMASKQVAAQVEEVKAQIQTRLEAKKGELIELQARIRAREDVRDGSGEGSGEGTGTGSGSGTGGGR